MSAVSHPATDKPGDLRRRALEDFLERIDTILAELDGDGGRAGEGIPFRASLAAATT